MTEPTPPSVLADTRAVATVDPTGQGTAATLLSYPGLHPVSAHRIAHRPCSARWGKPGAQAIATAAAKITGNTIHPGAVIGHRLFIDHGSEVVIGETSVIGDDVTIYQGASFVGDDSPGRRHALVGDGVLIGSGAKVVDPVIIGNGGNRCRGGGDPLRRGRHHGGRVSMTESTRDTYPRRTAR